jgi:hypothetical protein
MVSVSIERDNPMRFLRRSSMEDEMIGGDEAPLEPQQGTLAALLTASLSTVLAEAVSGLVGTAYAARIRRLEPRVHGGAEMLVEFLPRPSEIAFSTSGCMGYTPEIGPCNQ